MSDLDLSVRDITGLIRNIYAADPIAVAAMRETTRRSGRRAYDIAQDLCPVDTRFMKEHMKLELSEEEILWELGWDETDFEEAGLRFYPPYQEFGDGVRYKATPSITPAFHQESPRYQEELGRDIEAALERRRIP